MAAVAVVSVLALTSCGGDDSGGGGLPEQDEEQIVKTFGELQRAFAKSDPDAICAHLTLDAQERVGDAAHGVGSPCESNLTRFFDLIRSGGGFKPDNRQAEMVAVRADGRGAAMRVSLPSDVPVDLPFVKEGGSWKLDSLFGVSSAQAKRFASAIPSASFPEPDGEPVEVTDEDGEPCPELQERFGGDVRHATGGCTFEWFGAKHQPVTVSTLFGDFVLSDCNLGISLRVDSQGRTWTTDTNLGASTGGTSACGDVYRCTSDPGAEERTPGLEWPWRGRMSSDGNGGLVHHIALCWETCVGFFTGDLELRIRRDGKSWRAELQDDLDTSGFTLDQSLKVFKGGFDVRDA